MDLCQPEQRCLVVAPAQKAGHRRQAEAVAAALGLPLTVATPHQCAAAETVPDCRLALAAGRQAIAPARRLARRGLPVGVLQPVLWRPHDFALIWAPAHDGMRPGGNRMSTLTAPSMLTAAARAEGAAALHPAIAHLPRPVVGVAVGGPNRAYRFGRDEALELGAALAAFGAAHDASLVVAASRRTPAGTLQIIGERLGPTPFVTLGPPTVTDAPGADPFAGMIELADAVIVTADSSAMMSDVVAAGRPLYAWPLPGGRAKFSRFHTGLARHGALRWFDGSLETWRYPPLDAAATIAARLAPALGLDLSARANT